MGICGIYMQFALMHFVNETMSMWFVQYVCMYVRTG